MNRVASIVLSLIALFLIPSTVFAVDYSIENMNIEVFLQENGDAYVTETQTYEFFSPFNGITRTLIPKEGTSIVNFEAKENGAILKVEQEDNLYKVFRSGKSEEITVTISYIIKNGVEVHTDLAQFYWPFFDHNNESDYENIDIIVHPPQSTTNVIALGYHAAEATEEIQDDGSVQFSLGRVDSGINGDIRVAYDKSLFPSASLTEDSSIQAEMLAEIQKREDKKIAFEKRKDSLKDSALIVLGFYGVILLALLLYAWQKKQMTLADVERRYTSPYFVPEEETSLPATIFYTRGASYANTEVLSVAVLDLIRKKLVKQIDDETFEIIHRNSDYEHEQHLIDWLFYKVGKDGTFSLPGLKDYAKNKLSAGLYQQDYQTWRKLVQNEVKENELFERNTALRGGIAVLAGLLLPLAIAYAVHDLFANMFFSIILFGSLISFAILFRPITGKGAKIKKEWDEFLTKYVEFEEKDWEELQNDEQRRAFLYSSGVKDQRIKDKNEWFLNREPQIVYGDSNPMYFLLFASMTHSSFNSAHTSSAETMGSSSGPVTFGGGSGVGGGGGGSGAF